VKTNTIIYVLGNDMYWISYITIDLRVLI